MRSERRWIWILSGLAAIRVIVFAAAFPLFNNVDEQAHVDLVLKYSHGQPPRGVQGISREAAYYFALYGTPEYLNDPAQFGGQEFPQPFWLQPSDKRDEGFRPLVAEWEADTNFESGEPPLYYALAGLFWRIATLISHHAGMSFYFLRFLNAVIAASLVWVGYRAALLVFPETSFTRIAVPVLIAFFPQDTFYSIQSDVLSPLLFGIAFVGLLHVFRDEQPKISTGTYAGLSLSGASLTKTTNIPLLVVAAVALAGRARQLILMGNFRSYWRVFVTLAACAIVPLGGWLLWNYYAFGDATATATKIKHLGWTLKPFSQWWPHPVFSLPGLGQFWPELLASFWRGEFVWYGKRLAVPAIDSFYWISSTLALGYVAAVLSFRRAMPKFQRTALWLALGSFLAAIVFLVALSIAFDFGNCFYPSRARPYFTSGRLLSGATIPFVLLYAYALERTVSRAGRRWFQFLVLAIIVAVITISEIVVTAPVFASRYNFYHLLVNGPQSDQP